MGIRGLEGCGTGSSVSILGQEGVLDPDLVSRWGKEGAWKECWR